MGAINTPDNTKAAFWRLLIVQAKGNSGRNTQALSFESQANAATLAPQKGEEGKRLCGYQQAVRLYPRTDKIVYSLIIYTPHRPLMKFFPYGKNGHTIAGIGQYQSFLFSMSNESRPSASPQGEATSEGHTHPLLQHLPLFRRKSYVKRAAGRGSK